MTLVKPNSSNSLQQNSAGIKRICAHGWDDVRSKTGTNFILLHLMLMLFFLPYFSRSYSHLMFIAMRMAVLFFISRVDEELQTSAILTILLSLDVIATICIYFVPKVMAAKSEAHGVTGRGLNGAAFQSGNQNMHWNLQRSNQNTLGYRSGAASINQDNDYHDHVMTRQKSVVTMVEKSIQTDLGEIIAGSASITLKYSGFSAKESAHAAENIRHDNKTDAGEDRPPIIERKPTMTFEDDTQSRNETDDDKEVDIHIESENKTEHKKENGILDWSDRSDQWIPI